MEYLPTLNALKQNLYWLDLNAKHAIELKETFHYAAYNEPLRKTITGTNKVKCYGLCVFSLYFEFIMTLMRMFDSSKDDTSSFNIFFEHLSDDFIEFHESSSRRKVRKSIEMAQKEFQELKGSHLLSGLKTVRNNMFAHTSTKLERKQMAEYGYAEKLLQKIIPLLNHLNFALWDKKEPYDRVSEEWKCFAEEFWQSFSVNNAK